MSGWKIAKIRNIRGFRFWALLSLVMILLAPLAIFEPYDWLQRGLTEKINRKPYDGDAVIVTIDQETVEAQETKSWTKAGLANLIIKLDEAGASRFFVFNQRFSFDNSQGEDRLIEALANLNKKAVWQVEFTNAYLFDADATSEPAAKDQQSVNPRNFPSDEIARLVDQSSLVVDAAPFGVPLSMPWATTWRGETYPSTAQFLAGSTDFRPPISHWFGSHDVIDTSYDVDTIPTISATQVVSDDIDRGKIAGKNVVIADLGDLVFLIQKPATQRAAVAILGAQTMMDGPQYQLYVWSGLVIALLASFAWTVLPRPMGRLIGGGGIIILLISPVFLERAMIYQNMSHGLFFMTAFVIGRMVIRSRESVKSSRDVANTKSRFLAQASHDLRQPIHAIGLLAERLNQTELSETQKEIVAKISWSTDHASRMFKSLLDLAILESGTLKPKLSAVPVNDLLVEIDNQNALIAEQAGTILRFVPSELILNTDRSLANTMLQNLVSNAIKYSEGGDILIGCRREGETASLCVYDQGPGITQKEVQMVSQEFYRGQKLNVAGTDGVGLGLAIVRGLADLLSLHFKLKSVTGKGTVAKIGGFALAPQEQTLAFTEELEDTDLLAGKQVLVADDDVETLQSTAELLNMWGCRVSTATRMPESELDEFDIILTDFDFGDGLTLADSGDHIARQRDAGKCIVIVSGHHSSHIANRMGDTDITILSKPVNPADLRASLTAELSKQGV